MDLKHRHGLILSWMDHIKTMIGGLSHTQRQVQTKQSWKDLVTDTDIEIEKYLIRCIQAEFPHEAILGEESASQCKNSASTQPVQWIIDPIDGTVNYVNKQKDFATMIALYKQGVGQMGYIMDWNNQDLYYAFRGHGLYKNGQALGPFHFKRKLADGLIAINSKIVQQEPYQPIRQLTDHSLGVRMTGSAGLEILNVIRQDTVAYLSSSLMPWDIAAGQVMMEEVGLVCTTFDSKPFDLSQANSAIFAQPLAYQEIIEFIH